MASSGAISMISSDSQALGRMGEVITRTWPKIDKMKTQRGRLGDDEANGDYNFRAKRYIAPSCGPSVGPVGPVLIWTKSAKPLAASLYRRLTPLHLKFHRKR